MRFRRQSILWMRLIHAFFCYTCKFELESICKWWRAWLIVNTHTNKQTYQWWVECWTVHSDWWIRILIGWWIWCTINTDTTGWYTWIAGQCQPCWIILAWAHRLSWNRISNDWTAIFAAWLNWCGGRIRCLRLCTRADSTTWNTCCWSTSRAYWWPTAINEVHKQKMM